ncbi:MAG: MBL fold metallo-hydrolase [Anaerolineae bacterium]|nr:MBL fold metallo-hydrolase [Anaerolineae bacterium]
MQPLLPGVYAFSGLLVGRVYLIEGPDGLTIIDAGMALAADRVLRQLAAAGHAPGEVRRILITHAHFDHIGGLPRLKAFTGAEVIASTIEQPYVEGRAALPAPVPGQLGPLDRLMLRLGGKTVAPATPVDRICEDGDTVSEALGGLQAILTPGHTPGHTAYWAPEHGVLFCGDAMMRTPGLRLPFAAFTGDMAAARRAISRLANLTPAVVCFGHGAPLIHHTAATLQTFARRLEGR